MKAGIGKGLGLVVGLFLSACAIDPVEEPVGPQESWSGATRQQIVLAVEAEGGPSKEPVTLNVNDVLSDERTLLRAINAQFPSFGRSESLAEFVDSVDKAIIESRSRDEPRSAIELRTESEASSGIPEFDGLGGVLNRAFFRAIKQTLNSNRQFDRTRRVLLIVHGRIVDYGFDEDAGSGNITSITYFTTVSVPINTLNNRGRIISRTDAVRWNVAVEPEDRPGYEGFTVVERSYADPEDPFPGTMKFDEAMLDRINDLGFMFKLWVEGRSINIRDIAEKPHGTSTFVSLPHSDSRYRRSDANCIDMMFVAEPPPELGTLAPPFYCLGRCQNPHLVNTGADG